MQRKIHKHPQEGADYKRRQTNSWEDYHIFHRRHKKGFSSNIYGGPSSQYKVLCINCRKAFKVIQVNDNCMSCGNILITIYQRVKLPRKLASDKIWNKFIERFCK